MNATEGTGAEATDQELRGCPSDNARMPGNLELMVHGSPKQGQATEGLKALLERSEELTGTLFLAYPLKTDAVIISDRGQVTVIDLHDEPPAGNYRERQDEGFQAVTGLLQTHRDLMNGRNPRSRVQTISIASGLFRPDAENTEHPLVNMANAAGELEKFQQHPPHDVDPKTVVKLLLWVPSAG